MPFSKKTLTKGYCRPAVKWYCRPAPEGRQPLAVGDERSEEPTETIIRKQAPEGRQHRAPAGSPSPRPALPPLRGLFSKPPKTVGSSLRSSPTAKSCRPSGAENASHRRTRAPVVPDLASGRAHRPSGAENVKGNHRPSGAENTSLRPFGALPFHRKYRQATIIDLN
jgi:hypothetical protein